MNKIILSKIKKQCIAEFFGTLLVIFFGTGCIAATRLTETKFGQLEISIIWGMSVTIAIYLTSEISGAHLNPAITISFWIFFNFKRKKVIPYILSQTLGAFCASALIYILYYNMFFKYENVHNIIRGNINSLYLAEIFSTYPSNNISIIQSFLIEIFVTAILLFLVKTLNNNKEIIYCLLSPFLIGILISIIGVSIGPLTNISLNPARDFGPKTFAYLAGWGLLAYSGGKEFPYFLVPLIAPIIGACLGVFVYKELINR